MAHEPPRYDQRMQYQQGHPYPQPPYVQVHPKSPIGALILSFFIPGAGSMYAGHPKLGVPLLLAWLIVPGVLFGVGAAQNLPALVVLSWLAAAGMWIAGMCAAWADAKNWNRARGVLS